MKPALTYAFCVRSRITGNTRRGEITAPGRHRALSRVLQAGDKVIHLRVLKRRTA